MRNVWFREVLKLEEPGHMVKNKDAHTAGAVNHHAAGFSFSSFTMISFLSLNSLACALLISGDSHFVKSLPALSA